jgi:hypothetical protein
MLMDLETSLTLVLDLSQLSILFFHREKIMASITSMEKLLVPLRIHPLFRSIDVVVMMQLSLGNIWEEDGEGWLWCNQGAGWSVSSAFPRGSGFLHCVYIHW